MDELGEQIDGLVIGGYWGQGRRGGGMASFLIGLSASQNGKTMCVRPAMVSGQGQG